MLPTESMRPVVDERFVFEVLVVAPGDRIDGHQIAFEGKSALIKERALHEKILGNSGLVVLRDGVALEGLMIEAPGVENGENILVKVRTSPDAPGNLSEIDEVKILAFKVVKEECVVTPLADPSP